MSTVTLQIQLPTARTDGSAITPDQIAGTDIFDTAAINPAVAIGTIPGAGTSFTTSTLTVGDHTFTAETRDTTGHTSAESNPMIVTVPATLANPNPPIILSATLNP
jgi:hypothetical protein